MKYYGIKRKNQLREINYWYAKTSTKIMSIIPNSHHDYYRNSYEQIFSCENFLRNNNNSIPSGHWFKLERIITSDLILREDISKLQTGIRKLLKRYRSSKIFIGQPLDSLEDICTKIENMDSTLLSWYNGCRCGVFDFHGQSLDSSIAYFSMYVKNVNSSYLSLEFQIHLTDNKITELSKLINDDFHFQRGYAHKTLVSSKNGGSFSTYTLMHYNDEFLKAAQISDWISCIEWEFYNELKDFFPFVLHNQNIIPPRIEMFYTDIDYHENNKYFWDSVGVSPCHGQFIDDNHKMFFDYFKVDTDTKTIPRLIYIVKDDGIEHGIFQSVKDEAYFHINNYSNDYFRFLFLRILARDTGKKIVNYKCKLDKIKLKKNKLHGVLKQRYYFERDIDAYLRYTRDDLWSKSAERIERDIYHENSEILKTMKKPFCETFQDFYKGSVKDLEMTDVAIHELRKEFETKGQILQHLSDYKNSSKNWFLNVVMLLISACTLLFVIFPDRAEWVANMIRLIVAWMKIQIKSWL